MSVFQKTKRMVILAVLSVSIAPLSAAEKAPELLAQYLPDGQIVKGNMVTYLPTEEIEVFNKKMFASIEKNLEWYQEYKESSKPGVPLPFHENLGLTKEEYKEYRELWSKRTLTVIRPIEIRLESLGGKWMIRFAAKGGGGLTLLRYNSEEDSFEGVGGEMVRIEDVVSDPETMLGAWKGQEWRFKKESLLGRTKENFAIGKFADGKNGLIVYRMQTFSRQGAILLGEDMFIRFPLPGAK